MYRVSKDELKHMGSRGASNRDMENLMHDIKLEHRIKYGISLFCRSCIRGRSGVQRSFLFQVEFLPEISRFLPDGQKSDMQERIPYCSFILLSHPALWVIAAFATVPISFRSSTSALTCS